MSRNFSRFCCTAAALAVLIWLFGRFVLPIALPFLLGLWLAMAAEPCVRLLHRRLHLPRTLATAVSVPAVCILTIALLTLGLGLLTQQLARLQYLLPQLEQAFAQGLQLLRQWLAALPGALGDLLSHGLDGSSGEELLSGLPGMVAALAGKLSSGVFGLVTGIISGFMISARLPQLRQYIPEQWRSRYLPALKTLRVALGGWLLAQCKLAAVAFGLLALGFWILGVKDFLLWAGLTTLVDAFPVLGVGTVLLPWSAVCLIQGQYPMGLGLLGLYGTIWLTRSILEPRFLGKGLGLDPLLTLIAIYAGWRLFGIGGMLLGPVLTVAGTHIYQSLRQ